MFFRRGEKLVGIGVVLGVSQHDVGGGVRGKLLGG